MVTPVGGTQIGLPFSPFPLKCMAVARCVGRPSPSGLPAALLVCLLFEFVYYYSLVFNFWGERQKERESQAGSTASTEWDVGPSFTTLNS